jgi:NTP pyrophosphatase (non-canonical NTP hydrolase)
MQEFDLIVNWATKRNLIKGSKPEKQFLKLIEETGELASAIAKNDKPEQLDAVGDIIVVLTILSEQLGFNVLDAVQSAYNEIKDRKGRMINGCFVKESDLPENK